MAMGGSPLAEHGVGRNPAKQRLLEMLYGRAGVESMRAVKLSLDPAWKLAPGVLFEECHLLRCWMTSNEPLPGVRSGTRLLFLSDYDGTLAEFNPTRPFLSPRAKLPSCSAKSPRATTCRSASSAAGELQTCARGRSCPETCLSCRASWAGNRSWRRDRWQHPDLNQRPPARPRALRPVGQLYPVASPGSSSRTNTRRWRFTCAVSRRADRAAALAEADRCAQPLGRQR